jgi:hypothetical protein
MSVENNALLTSILAALTDSRTAYDNRFGTDTTRSGNTGLDTFDLHASAARIWVNSTRADDTGDGLSAATAKKTLDAAIIAMWTRNNPADQLMIAGTGGRSYVDSSGYETSGIQGISLAYPVVFQSYDPADPTGATTKFGELWGANRPRITTTNNFTPLASPRPVPVLSGMEGAGVHRKRRRHRLFQWRNT